MDFTVKIYRKLLDQLIQSGYNFQTFSQFLENPEDKVILLRHDVDDKKLNSLRFARIQNELGIKGTYYFRMVPQSFDEKVIKEIADLGHEIGYHYEDMDFAAKQRAKIKRQRPKEEELYEAAIGIFENNLNILRNLYPVKTICMHGSPRSPFDNKAIWKKYNYRDYGIIGEPYFDIDFNEVFYLTDTGRRWDGEKVSVRDKVDSSKFGVEHTPHLTPRTPFTSFHSTRQIIAAAKKNDLPDRIMFTFHPQRWSDNPFSWVWELIFQNLKNQVKRYMITR